MNTEAKINKIVARLHKEIYGVGPTKVKSYILDNIMLIRFDKPDDTLLSSLKKCEGGQEVINNMQQVLYNNYKSTIFEKAEKIIGVEVDDFIYKDFNNYTSSLIIIIFKDEIPSASQKE